MIDKKIFVNDIPSDNLDDRLVPNVKYVDDTFILLNNQISSLNLDTI